MTLHPYLLLVTWLQEKRKVLAKDAKGAKGKKPRGGSRHDRGQALGRHDWINLVLLLLLLMLPLLFFLCFLYCKNRFICMYVCTYVCMDGCMYTYVFLDYIMHIANLARYDIIV